MMGSAPIMVLELGRKKRSMRSSTMALSSGTTTTTVSGTSVPSTGMRMSAFPMSRDYSRLEGERRLSGSSRKGPADKYQSTYQPIPIEAASLEAFRSDPVLRPMDFGKTPSLTADNKVFTTGTGGLGSSHFHRIHDMLDLDSPGYISAAHNKKLFREAINLVDMGHSSDYLRSLYVSTNPVTTLHGSLPPIWEDHQKMQQLMYPDERQVARSRALLSRSRSTGIIPGRNRPGTSSTSSSTTTIRYKDESGARSIGTCSVCGAEVNSLRASLGIC